MLKKTVSRNSPCPCGSGKKYKFCCLNKEVHGTQDPLWRQLRQVDEKIVHQLFTYARDTYGEEAIYEAWDDFINYREDMEFDFDSPHNRAFFPWFLFNWQPEEWEEEDADESEYDDTVGSTVAGSFMEKHHRRLSKMERRFVELCVATDFSFHEVLKCQPGEGFILRDILLEREVFVTEHSASEAAQKGDILFAKVIQYDRIGLMVGCGPVLIPPVYKPSMIDLRAFMQTESGDLTEEDFPEWDVEIRDIYFDIYDRMHTPPEIFNTDGDPFCLHDLCFKITSPQRAFESLKSLAIDVAEDELLQRAEFDDEGNLKKIEIPWRRKGQSKIPGSDYTLLGSMSIEDTKLKVTINSENRAVKIRKEIEERLGDQVTYQSMEVKSVESLLEGKPDTPTEELDHAKHPDLEKVMDKMLASHWKKWIDENIPALGGITPRQAIKDKDGREKVIALLDDFVRHEERREGGVSQLKYIQQVRKKLGLE